MCVYIYIVCLVCLLTCYVIGLIIFGLESMEDTFASRSRLLALRLLCAISAKGSPLQRTRYHTTVSIFGGRHSRAQVESEDGKRFSGEARDGQSEASGVANMLPLLRLHAHACA